MIHYLCLDQKLISERKEILNKVDKLIFISEWVKKRFFIGLENLSAKTEVIYHSVKQEKKLKNLIILHL